MKNRQILFWSALIVALIAGTGIGLPLLINKLNHETLYPADTMITLFLAAYTLEATLIIAVLIYSLQNNSAKQAANHKEESAKRIIYTELTTGLQSVICSGSAQGISSHLSELFLTYLPDMQKCLAPEQLHDLIRAIDILTDTRSDTATEHIRTVLSDFIQPQFHAALSSPFAGSFSRISDYRCVLNPVMRNILLILSKTSLPPISETTLYSPDGKKVIECCGHDRYKIYNENGGLLCDAVFDKNNIASQGIQSGWVKLEQYEGEYLNGRRHGRGCSYSVLYHHKLFEGIWREGKPYDGVQFDIVVEKRLGLSGDYDLLFPYWNDQSLFESSIMDQLFPEDSDHDIDLSRIYVCNLQGLVDGEKTEPFFLRPLLDFMQKEDPKHYDAIIEYIEDCKVCDDDSPV